MPARPTSVRRADAPERRLLDLQLRDVDTTDSLSFLEGLAVPYDTVTDTGWWYTEDHAPGVANESVADHPNLPLLFWHNNRTYPMGVAEQWNDDPDGLRAVWRLDDHPDAQRAARQARDGFLTGLSIGFAPIRSEWTYTDWDDFDPEDASTYDHVRRLQIRLLETSITPTPAYADAQVALVRSLDGRRNRTRPMGRRPTPAARMPVPRSSGRNTPATPALDAARAWRATL